MFLLTFSRILVILFNFPFFSGCAVVYLYVMDRWMDMHFWKFFLGGLMINWYFKE